MKHFRIVILLLLLSIIIQQSFGQDYYWSDQKKHYLNDDPNKFVVKPKSGIAYDEISKIISTQKEIIGINELNSAILISTRNLDKMALKRQNLFEGIIPAKKLGETLLLFTGEILLQPKVGVAIEKIISLVNDDISVRIKSKYNTYVMDVNNWDSIFVYANQIYESGLVEYSHPNFIAPLELYSDPLYPQQYYLNNNSTGIDINAPEAWDFISNFSNPAVVKVAVIDDGVENHEDISGHGLQGFTALYSYSNPNTNGAPNANDRPDNYYDGVPVANDPFGHGQCCAGIIAASHNSIGIKGIAPTSLIIPINIFNDWYGREYAQQKGEGGPDDPKPDKTNREYLFRETAKDIANAINVAWDSLESDVISNSWWYPHSNALLIANADHIIYAINRARTEGRGGLGSVVIFASGNLNNNGQLSVAFPANVDGVVTVGAVDRDGVIWNYSKRGPQMDLVAPSGDGDSTSDIVTIDRMGNKGYNNGNYRMNFNGTSASCPQVAGVVALMLSVNPALTEPEVKAILQQTATDLGTSGFDNTYLWLWFGKCLCCCPGSGLCK
jgi:subtilisin family serine protease